MVEGEMKRMELGLGRNRRRCRFQGWYLGNPLTIMSLLYIHGCPGVPAYVGWVPRYLGIYLSM